MSSVPLDTSLVAFITGAVSIIASGRNADNVPDLARAAGCRVDDARLTILLSASQSTALLGDLAANGQIAVVFSQPSTARTVQLKGRDARPTTLLPDDAARMSAYREGMVAELARIGYDAAFTEALFWADPADVVAVTFTPGDAFTQTPGPNAGARLRGAGDT